MCYRSHLNIFYIWLQNTPSITNVYAVIATCFVTNSCNLLITYTHKKLWVWKLFSQPWNVCIFSAVRTNWCFPFIVPHQLNRELNALRTQQWSNFSLRPLIVTAVSNLKDKRLPLSPEGKLSDDVTSTAVWRVHTRPEQSIVWLEIWWEI